jgi:hypothetical protein
MKVFLAALEGDIKTPPELAHASDAPFAVVTVFTTL